MRAPISEVSSCYCSNHLDINSAWKLLVASCVCVCVRVCVCVAEAQTRVFDKFVSSASVHLQHETHSSSVPEVFVPAQNVFVASDKHVHCSVIVRIWR